MLCPWVYVSGCGGYFFFFSSRRRHTRFDYDWSSDVCSSDLLELFPQNQTLARWMKLAKERIKFQGLPARICWLGYGDRAEFGMAMNDLVRRGELKAPIVIEIGRASCRKGGRCRWVEDE